MDHIYFEKMARRVRPRLLAIGRSILQSEEDAEDVAQETLLRLWTIRDKVDGYESVDALAVTVARNLCISRKRKEATQQHSETDVTTWVTPESRMEERENDIWLRHAISSLPSGQMTILRMKQSEGMEIAEIARTLAMTEVAVRQQLSRARKNLFEEMKKRRLI